MIPMTDSPPRDHLVVTRRQREVVCFPPGYAFGEIPRRMRMVVIPPVLFGDTPRINSLSIGDVYLLDGRDDKIRE